MSNIYHIINFIPGFTKEEVLIGHEDLAHQVVKSGRLRIDAGDKINFGRLYIPNLDISMMFSYREVYDQSLIKQTRGMIAAQLSGHYGGKGLEAKIDEYIEMLKSELNKYIQPTEEEEMTLARLLVQSTHPSVTMLVLLDKTEIFISHSYNIGDMLDVVNWHSSGKNSGMQSTDGRDAAVFVSCGGDPLKENKDKNAKYGDGWPAIARLFVISGQEFGHYSDIMRDEHGRQISRYSANFSGTRAKEDARIGRLNDIKYSKEVLKTLEELGLGQLVTLEKDVNFYLDNKVYNLSLVKNWVKLFFKTRSFMTKARQQGFGFVDNFKEDHKPATLIKAMIEDMLFNLAPQADVYKSDDKDEEEAIACIEALARIPQQVNKWGRASTRTCMRDLYKLYYNTVIPGCIKAYENITHKPYHFNSNKPKVSLLYKISNLFRKRTFPTREA